MNGQLTHDASGESFDLIEVTYIGRSSQSTITVPDPRASRSHALIRQQDDGFWFFDLGSSNGSYLNEKRVTTAQLLRNGDLIRIGEFRLSFQCSGEPQENLSQTFTDQTIVQVQSKTALILVSDIQGFTSLSEQLTPDQLAPIIGTWYAETERVLEKHNATLDKFIGDCLLAYWLDTSPASRISALRTAHAMQRVCDQVQEVHAATLSEVGLSFKTGTAIHRGPTAYGAISAGEFTLLGDAVNLAFRLEALTRSLEKRVLVSADFLEDWDTGRSLCEPCGSKNVKGRNEAVEVFSLERTPD